jgi:hypothetical protein
VIAVPGASEQTSQVKVLNANWVAEPDGDDGKFEVMIVTADGQQHTVSPSPTSMTRPDEPGPGGHDPALGPR